MSSWPWMKDAQVAIADPIDPVCLEDDRPAVKELIEAHAAKITKIRNALVAHPLYDETKHDDLWIVRFWLTYKKSRPAIRAAKQALEFRAEYNLDEHDIRGTPPHKALEQEEGEVAGLLRQWKDHVDVIMSSPDPTSGNEKRNVVAFLKKMYRLEHQQPSTIVVENLSEDDSPLIFMYFNEWTHQWVDYVSRTTGRLTRSVRFVDTEGRVGLPLRRKRRNCDGITTAIGELENCYPQMLESMFVGDASALVKAVWKFVRFLMPKKVSEKFDILINPRERELQERDYRHLTQDENDNSTLRNENTVPVLLTGSIVPMLLFCGAEESIYLYRRGNCGRARPCVYVICINSSSSSPVRASSL